MIGDSWVYVNTSYAVLFTCYQPVPRTVTKANMLFTWINEFWCVLECMIIVLMLEQIIMTVNNVM